MDQLCSALTVGQLRNKLQRQKTEPPMPDYNMVATDKQQIIKAGQQSVNPLVAI